MVLAPAGTLAGGVSTTLSGEAATVERHYNVVYNGGVSDLTFEWDARKDAANRKSHGVGFQEAATVFADDNALFMGDPEHSEAEDRFVLLGLSCLSRILLVCHCFRADEDIIRIISARKANRAERAEYNRRL